MNDFFVNDLNSLSAKEDKYYLMNDVNRFSDAEYDTPEEAEAAIEEAESELDVNPCCKFCNSDNFLKDTLKKVRRFKDYPNTFLGGSDIGSLIFRFGEKIDHVRVMTCFNDGECWGYIVPFGTELPDEYKQLDEGAWWLTVYDDEHATITIRTKEKPIKVFVSDEGHSPVIMVPSDAEVKRKDGLDDDPHYGGITY